MCSHTGRFLQLQMKSVLVSASWVNSTLDRFHDKVLQTLLEVSFLTGRCWYTQCMQLCLLVECARSSNGPSWKDCKTGNVSTFHSFEVAVTSKVLSCHGEESLSLFQLLHFS